MGDAESMIRLAALLLAVHIAGACGGSPGSGDAAPDADDDSGVDADLSGDAEGDSGAATWRPAENLSDSFGLSDLRMNWGNAIALGEDGSVHATWREVSGEQEGLDVAEVVYRRWTVEGWGPVQALTDFVAGNGHPKIAVSGAVVFVVWHQFNPEPGGDDQIFLALSTEAGRPGSFLAPRVVVSDATVTSRSPLGEYATTPSIAAQGQWAHVVWADDRIVEACGTNVSEIYLLSSADGGLTWSGVQPVSEPDCRSSWTPSVAAWGDFVHVAWTDERHDDQDCALEGGRCREEEYYRRLGDHGRSRDDPELRLTSDPPGSPAESWAPSIAAFDGTVQVVFMDRSGGGDFEVYHLRSLDEGASFEATARRLTESALGCLSARGTVAGSGSIVNVVWMTLCGDTQATVYHAWSADLGASWSATSEVTSGTGRFAIQPSIAYRPGEAHVLWTDSGEIYYSSATVP